MNRKQLELNLNGGKQGGRRTGSGRKRIRSLGVAHRTRGVVGKVPLHINFKYKVTIKNKQCLRNLKRAILNARRLGMRVIHFSLQSNHIHLIVEADSNEILTSGMRSLTVTFAKGVGRGRIQLERYHLHILRSLREARNAVRYVLFNEQKHSIKKFSKIESYSSLLAENNALEIIRRFAMKERVTLTIGIKDDFKELSKGRSFHLKKALEYLTQGPLIA